MLSLNTSSIALNYNNTLVIHPSGLSNLPIQPTTSAHDIDVYFASMEFISSKDIKKTKNSLNELSNKVDEFIDKLSHFQRIVDNKRDQGFIHSTLSSISRWFLKNSISSSLDNLKELKRDVTILQPNKGALRFLDADWQKAVERQDQIFQSQAQKIESQLKSAKEMIFLLYSVALDSEPARATDDKSINPAVAQAWVQAHSEETREVAQLLVDNFQYIDFETFERKLAQTCDSFNEYMDKLSPEERLYVISVSSETCKSDRWVAALAQKYLKYTPLDIVTHDDLKRMYPDIKHAVLLDDAAYAGMQMKKVVLDTLANNSTLAKLHAIIPFMASKAERKLTKNGQGKLILHSHEKLSSIEEIFPNTDIQQKIWYMYALGTKHAFLRRTMTYFAHKFPDHISTLQINRGREAKCKIKQITPLDDCERITLVPKITPPYKVGCWESEISELITKIKRKLTWKYDYGYAKK